MVHAHSGLRWVVLLALIVAIVMAFMQWRKNSPYSKSSKMVNLISMTLVHVQWLLGIVLLFTSGKVVFSSEMMGNSVLRFFAVEHPFMMTLAIVLISIGYSKAKRATEGKAHKHVFVFYLIGLLVLLAGIPWPFQQLGASWM